MAIKRRIDESKVVDDFVDESQDEKSTKKKGLFGKIFKK